VIAGISDRWFDNDRVLVVVVAVVTEGVDWAGVDWAAYQDAISVTGMYGNKEHSDIMRLLVHRASKTGDKVSEAEARALFPGIELPYRS
jgi:hypothetical protein